MYTKAHNLQEAAKFQTVAQNRFSQELTSSAVCVSEFIPKTKRTVTPSESGFISINRRRTYHYNEK